MHNRLSEQSKNVLCPDIMRIIKTNKTWEEKGEKNRSYSKYINCFIYNNLELKDII